MAAARQREAGAYVFKMLRSPRNWWHWLYGALVGFSVLAYNALIAFLEIPDSRSRWLVLGIGILLSVAVTAVLTARSVKDEETSSAVRTLMELYHQPRQVSGSGGVQVPTPVISATGGSSAPSIEARLDKPIPFGISSTATTGGGNPVGLDERIQEQETRVLRLLGANRPIFAWWNNAHPGLLPLPHGPIFGPRGGIADELPQSPPREPDSDAAP